MAEGVGALPVPLISARITARIFACPVQWLGSPGRRLAPYRRAVFSAEPSAATKAGTDLKPTRPLARCRPADASAARSGARSAAGAPRPLRRLAESDLRHCSPLPQLRTHALCARTGAPGESAASPAKCLLALCMRAYFDELNDPRPPRPLCAISPAAASDVAHRRPSSAPRRSPRTGARNTPLGETVPNRRWCDGL